MSAEKTEPEPLSGEGCKNDGVPDSSAEPEAPVTSEADSSSSSVFKAPADTGPTATIEFKAPSFSLPVKKKVKSTSAAEEAFAQQSPEPKNKAPDCETQKESEADDERAFNAIVAHQIPQKKPLLSPAEQLKQTTQSPVPYKEPAWGGACEEKFKLEVIKNGAVVDIIDLTTRNYHVIGRLPSCNIPMEHPSLSRLVIFYKL